MKKQLDSIRATREYLLSLTNDLSVEELNRIPSGFNNNIIWNMAHLVSAQQGVCYKRARLDVVIEDKYFRPYLPGTKPDSFVDDNEISVIKGLLFSTLDQFENDYNQNIFGNYHVWTTRYGVELKSINETLGFLAFHEGMHFGYIMALKKIIKSSYS